VEYIDESEHTCIQEILAVYLSNYNTKYHIRNPLPYMLYLDCYIISYLFLEKREKFKVWEINLMRF